MIIFFSGRKQKIWLCIMYILFLDILVIKIKFFFFHSDTEYKKKK